MNRHLTYDEIKARIDRFRSNEIQAHGKLMDEMIQAVNLSANPIWVTPFLEKEEIFPQNYFPQERDFVTTDDK